MAFRPIRALAAAALLVTAWNAPVASAAQSDVAASIAIAQPAEPLPCGTPFPLEATVRDAAGAPISEKEVTWVLLPEVSSQDTVVEFTSATDTAGVATTHVYLDCLAGDRHVEAKADDASASIVLTITIADLPATSTAPIPESDAPLTLVGLLMAALAGLLAGVALLRRQRVP